MAADTVPVGELRWPVRIYRREQVPSLVDAGIVETLEPFARRHARIEASHGVTYRGSIQAGGDVITHMIWMRWVAGLDDTFVIVRPTILPGGGIRTEIFRVRRILEMGGRKRFVMVEAEEERH
ncbi:phage head completion protein [Roseomonas chloroacetimidivorans]|uniref:phage head completion protein n=1 Tax=Roseomonas chloroacetimidivorans TaxID=1766656 RepID=UPI003C77A40C